MDRAEKVRQSGTFPFERMRRRRRQAPAAGASLLEAPGRLREPASKLRMTDMRLRLGRQSTRDFVHVAARLRDRIIEIGRKVTRMNREELPSAAALLAGGPVG